MRVLWRIWYNLVSFWGIFLVPHVGDSLDAYILSHLAWDVFLVPCQFRVDMDSRFRKTHGPLKDPSCKCP